MIKDYKIGYSENLDNDCNWYQCAIKPADFLLHSKDDKVWYCFPHFMISIQKGYKVESEKIKKTLLK